MKTLPEKCDYLIVGSGAAGAIVAARLSENLDASVILHLQQLPKQLFLGMIRAGRISGGRANAPIYFAN